MNHDSKLIFEAYQAKLISEAPVSGLESDILPNPEKINDKPSYGIGKAAGEAGSKEDVLKKLVNTIIVDVFTKKEHEVGESKYDLYFPGTPEEFRKAIADVVKKVLEESGTKVSTTDARYTARVIDNLLNVSRQDVEGHVKSPKQRKPKSEIPFEPKKAGAAPESTEEVNTTPEAVEHAVERAVKEEEKSGGILGMLGKFIRGEFK